MCRLVAALFSLMLLAGCATSLTLPVDGSVQQTGERFWGTATGYADGSGNLQISSSAGVTCQGNFVYITRRNGRGVFLCSDGRSGPFSFVSTGNRGVGSGSLGNDIFTFTFG
jgi:hypothetical protein